METIRQDLRYTLRTLRRTPGFAVATLFTLALGIGFSLVSLNFVSTALSGPLPDSGWAIRPDLPPTGAGWTDEARGVLQLQGEGLHMLLWILGGATLLVLGIVCSSILILFLARATGRRQEMAVRAVVGAGRRRVLRQLLTEGVLIGAVGGALGVLLGWVGLGVLRASWPEGLPPWLGTGLDPRAAAIAIGAPLLITQLVAIAPVAVVLRRNLYGALTAGSRATAGPAEGQFRTALTVLAVAASLVLLSCAGLLLRGFLTLQTADQQAGDPGRMLTLQLDLPETRYAEEGARLAFVEALRGRINAFPGVVDSSVASPGTWVGMSTEDRVRTVCPECSRGTMYLPVVQGMARQHVVTPGFFQSQGIPLLRGREFSTADAAGADGVIVINETFAYRLFPRGEPLGKQVQIGGRDGPWFVVVGIVRDVRARGIGSGSEPVPALYLSALQHPPRSFGLVVHTAGDPLTIAPVVEDALRAMDAALVPSAVMSMEEHLDRFRAPLQWFAQIFAVMAGFAVLLASLGLFSVVAYNVTRRTREIGVRMALGAQARAVTTMVVRQGMHLTGVGLLLGFWGAFSLARLLQVYFYGVNPLDPLTYGSVALLLGGIALLASYLPARRGARVDPVIALRAE